MSVSGAIHSPQSGMVRLRKMPVSRQSPSVSPETTSTGIGSRASGSAKSQSEGRAPWTWRMCIAAPSAECPANWARYSSKPRGSLRLRVSRASASL